MSTVAAETTAPKAQASQSGFASTLLLARETKTLPFDWVRSRRLVGGPFLFVRFARESGTTH
jgi:hypothetical protein